MGWWVSVPIWVVFVFLLYLFRDFPRQIPPLPLAAVSPADGRIGSIGLARDPFLERESLRIRIRQSRWGEFNLHSPIEGRVMRIWTREYQEAAAAKGDDLAIHIRTDERDDVVIALDAAPRFSYHRCDVSSGERVGQGRRCGFAGFGRRLDVYLPVQSRLSTEQGARVFAGRDVLATFVHA
jgi:phosphatidylserine decarboxylase